ncbi:MAG: hypothetical protein DSY95_03615, partial [SAR324 cluster bacterium]
MKIHGFLVLENGLRSFQTKQWKLADNFIKQAYWRLNLQPQKDQPVFKCRRCCPYHFQQFCVECGAL